MRKVIIFASLMTILLVPMVAAAVEKAPRITDREIVERLTRLEEGQKALNKRFDDLRAEMNGRFDDLRAEMNERFNTLQWMLGLFITISLVILGFVLRMQWQMQRRQADLEATLNAHKNELAFLKNLIEKLLPPKGIL
jgi:DNA-binding GntR family transcriptional regulator